MTDHVFDSQSVIDNLYFEPSFKLTFSIPLYCLLSMPLVRPTLIFNILKLEQGFVHRYTIGCAVFYVLLTNNYMKTQDVASELIDY